MTADGMTKGAVDRAAIENCMNGSIEIKHDLKRWEPLVRKQTTSLFVLAATQPSSNDNRTFYPCSTAATQPISDGNKTLLT